MIERISQRLAGAGIAPVVRCEPLLGGCINENYRLFCEDGNAYFFKCCDHPPTGFYPAEARGLSALGHDGSIAVPQVLWVCEQGLLLEWLSAERPTANYWERFGCQLALLHRAPAPAFGFTEDNFCGLTPQPNPRQSDGYRFFGEERLLYQAGRAYAAGLLEAEDLHGIERIVDSLPGLIPPQPPSLIHGDLWSGNHLCHQGSPVLIDPAAHWGWAEAELAMTRLFGGYPQAFYRSYLETHPLEAGWQDRMGLYNLYHLLNHLNLFGEGYLGQVRSTISRYL